MCGFPRAGIVAVFHRSLVETHGERAAPGLQLLLRPGAVLVRAIVPAIQTYHRPLSNLSKSSTNDVGLAASSAAEILGTSMSPANMSSGNAGRRERSLFITKLPFSRIAPRPGATSRHPALGERAISRKLLLHCNISLDGRKRDCRTMGWSGECEPEISDRMPDGRCRSSACARQPAATANGRPAQR